jgi:hypothetical protein
MIWDNVEYKHVRILNNVVLFTLRLERSIITSKHTRYFEEAPQT